MASTIIQFDIPEDLLPITAFLTKTEAGLIDPNISGYTISSGLNDWEYKITVPEACVGVYRIIAQNGDGVTIAQGWVLIEADDTNTYIAEESYASVKLRENSFDNADITLIATEIVKIPRKATPVNGGDPVTRNKLSISDFTITETLT